ncbi:hypothetical protein [Streptomyces sp. NPDC089799]|uniref:hypothetical protein n=1 Tax=Streptomyces sp. NPDC089799 TaxID=3155066 RepID=UPI0034326874
MLRQPCGRRSGNGRPLGPDGWFVVAGSSCAHAPATEGGLRRELSHDPWHGTARTHCTPAVSPDGRRVSVVVPTLEPEEGKAALVYGLEPGRNCTGDDLLLLDASTGAVLSRPQIRSVSGDREPGAPTDWPC